MNAMQANPNRKLENFQRVIDGSEPPQAPPVQEKPSLKSKVTAFCLSRLGVTMASFVLFFVLLLATRPVFIFQRPQEGDDPTVRRVNYWVVFGIAIIGALLTYFVPALLISKRTETCAA